MRRARRRSWRPPTLRRSPPARCRARPPRSTLRGRTAWGRRARALLPRRAAPRAARPRLLELWRVGATEGASSARVREVVGERTRRECLHGAAEQLRPRRERHGSLSHGDARLRHVAARRRGEHVVDRTRLRDGGGAAGRLLEQSPVSRHVCVGRDHRGRRPKPLDGETLAGASAARPPPVVRSAASATCNCSRAARRPQSTGCVRHPNKAHGGAPGLQRATSDTDARAPAPSSALARGSSLSTTSEASVVAGGFIHANGACTASRGARTRSPSSASPSRTEPAAGRAAVATAAAARRWCGRARRDGGGVPLVLASPANASMWLWRRRVVGGGRLGCHHRRRRSRVRSISGSSPFRSCPGAAHAVQRADRRGPCRHHRPPDASRRREARRWCRSPTRRRDTSHRRPAWTAPAGLGGGGVGGGGRRRRRRRRRCRRGGDGGGGTGGGGDGGGGPAPAARRRRRAAAVEPAAAVTAAVVGGGGDGGGGVGGGGDAGGGRLGGGGEAAGATAVAVPAAAATVAVATVAVMAMAATAAASAAATPRRPTVVRGRGDGACGGDGVEGPAATTAPAAATPAATATDTRSGGGGTRAGGVRGGAGGGDGGGGDGGGGRAAAPPPGTRRIAAILVAVVGTTSASAIDDAGDGARRFGRSRCRPRRRPASSRGGGG